MTQPIAPGGTPSSVNYLSGPISPSRQMPVVDRSKVDPRVIEAAEGMEAMFIDYMMKVMRQTVPKNELDMENTATDIYRGMLDSEFAERAARAGGVGLSDQIIAYMEAASYNQYRPPNPETKRSIP